MTLEKQIKDDMKQAMKDGQAGKLKLGIIRMLLADISNAKIDLKKQDGELTDDEVKEVTKAFVKKINQEIEELVKYKRDASLQEAQKEVLMGYLPVQMSGDEIAQLVDNTIFALGVTDIKQLGRVMGALKDYKDRVDMKVVKGIAEVKLNSLSE